MGSEPPQFDPDGPPDERRAAIEHLLTRGLVTEDADGRVVPAAAESISVSDDQLTYTFNLRPRLAFVDGTPCVSADFRRALMEGLLRTDHSTRRWQLAAVRGVDAIRLGRPLPELGIESPDDRTLRLELALADPELLAKLAIPGTSDPWKRREAGRWRDAVGLGPYRVVQGDSVRVLVLAQPASSAKDAAMADTLTLRFVPAPGRVRGLIRDGLPDLVWPVPGGIADDPALPGYRVVVQDSRPVRRLALVMRADLPPTTKLAARHALAHGINRTEVTRVLGLHATDVGPWMPGAPPFELPRLDPVEIESWRESGRLGRSFHVSMAYDANGPAAEIARVMQGEWSAHAIYIELVAKLGGRRVREFLDGRSHLVLGVLSDLIESPSGRLAPLIMPLRGPAVGAVRTGWRTREFDSVILPSRGGTKPDPATIQRRVEEERIFLPLARLPWIWIERGKGPAAPYHPRYGPQPPAPSVPR